MSRCLALYLERQVQPRRPKVATKLTLALLSRLFPWRQALTIVKPDTLIRWHRQGFRLLWKWKSKPRGRPRIPAELQKLIVEMAGDNPTWGEERIAAELLLKVGIRISARTVSRYMPKDKPARPLVSTLEDVCTQPRRRHSGLRLLRDRNGQLSGAVRLCDHGGRHTQDRPRQRHGSSYGRLGTSAVSRGHHWRETLPIPRPRPRLHLLFGVRFGFEGDGPEHSQTPFRAPQANAFCERLVGSIRRECLDFLIPVNERHLRGILKEWLVHYNKARPHSSLGPGVPKPSGGIPVLEISGHRIPCGHRVVGNSVLSGLHHEYRMEKAAA